MSVGSRELLHVLCKQTWSGLLLFRVIFLPNNFLSRSYLGPHECCASPVTVLLFLRVRPARQCWCLGGGDESYTVVWPQKSFGGNRVLVQRRAAKTDLNEGLFTAQLYPKAAAAPCQLHLERSDFLVCVYLLLG